MPASLLVAGGSPSSSQLTLQTLYTQAARWMGIQHGRLSQPRHTVSVINSGQSVLPLALGLGIVSALPFEAVNQATLGRVLWRSRTDNNTY